MDNEQKKNIEKELSENIEGLNKDKRSDGTLGKKLTKSNKQRTKVKDKVLILSPKLEAIKKQKKEEKEKLFKRIYWLSNTDVGIYSSQILETQILTPEILNAVTESELQQLIEANQDILQVIDNQLFLIKPDGEKELIKTYESQSRKPVKQLRLT